MNNRSNLLRNSIVIAIVIGAFILGYTSRGGSLSSFLSNRKEGPVAQTQPAEHGADQGQQKSAEGGGERKVLYWYDSMNPLIHSDKAGKASDGMDMVPKYADEMADMKDMPSGTVKLSDQRQQMIGVRMTEVKKQNITRTIRTVGRVEMDETRISHVHVKNSGWIENLNVDFTGKLVSKGQALFSIYSPDLVSTQQEYLIASRGQQELGKSSYPNVTRGVESLKKSALERLRLWDVTETQIEKLEKTGEVSRTITFYSHISGFVVERKALEHMFVTPDMELYTIADLSRVWLLADIYENELPNIHVGQSAKVQLSYSPGITYSGKVTYIYPTVDMNTHTAKVRLEFANPGFTLKPNMFADVDLSVEYGEHLTLPTEAVMDSGTRQLVFIARPGGYFEPREVKLGARLDNQYIVLSGIKQGELVVTSGNFLIDSESRLSSVTDGMKH